MCFEAMHTIVQWPSVSCKELGSRKSLSIVRFPEGTQLPVGCAGQHGRGACVAPSHNTHCLCPSMVSG